MFETLKAFDDHLPCKRPTKWKEPKFKEVQAEEPEFSEVTFVEPYTGDPGGARWAGETTPDRVNSGLRTRRIRALTWEPPEEPNKNIFRRFYEWLMK